MDRSSLLVRHGSASNHVRSCGVALTSGSGRRRARFSFALWTRAPSRSFRIKRRLEKVHEQAGRTAKPSQQSSRFEPLESTAANHSSDHRAVLLIDKGLVVLAIWAAAREDDRGSED
ncbi:hypothetical protein LMTR13_26895 [Bradyrhizobium icense]|uniref:Uncharacterized protein n=1 Tax=Bradyrhizobium icense TaxID=1274631 RepID=A0A1B1UKJ4_9BRAD|nr:hypothetical protein LMTR13_26895 [Bradyrhizobium icense]